MAVVSRFRVLLAEKATKERRSISLSDVARDTGVSIYTITAFANNTIREAPLDVVDTLCRYLGVTPGDLLVQERESGDQPSNINRPGTLAVAY